jgi:hypothetical protein
LIRQRKLNSASEFARQMTDAGFKMSSSHASRYEKENPPAFDLKFINVACNVLQCLPNELYDIQVELEPGEEVDPMVIFPHHALVKQAATSTGFQENATPRQSKATEEKEPNKPESPKSKSRKNSKQGDEDSDDTGPSGILFPFKRD